MAKHVCITRSKIQYQHGDKSVQPIGTVLVLDEVKYNELHGGIPLVGPLAQSEVTTNLNAPNTVFSEEGGFIVSKGGGHYIVADNDGLLVKESVQGFENARGLLGGKASRKADVPQQVDLPAKPVNK